MQRNELSKRQPRLLGEVIRDLIQQGQLLTKNKKDNGNNNY